MCHIVAVGEDHIREAVHRRDYHSRAGHREARVQVHGIDNTGAVILRRKLRRSELIDFFRSLKPCLIGLEACAAEEAAG
jgi:hypothetical protein